MTQRIRQWTKPHPLEQSPLHGRRLLHLGSSADLEHSKQGGTGLSRGFCLATRIRGPLTLPAKTKYTQRK